MLYLKENYKTFLAEYHSVIPFQQATDVTDEGRKKKSKVI